MHSSTFNHHYSLMQRALTLQGFRPKTIEAYLRTLRRVDERLKKGSHCRNRIACDYK